MTRARGKPSPVARPLHGIAWIVTAMLLVVAFLRIVAWDDLLLLAVLNAFQLFLYLPAWVIAAAAAGFRRWWLAAASLVVVAAQLSFVLPEFTAATPVPADARGAETFRLFDANVSQDNRSMAGYVAQIRRLQPDLVTMEEFTPADLDQLTHAGALRALPHVYAAPAYGSRGFLIACRYPLGGVSVSRIEGLTYLLRTTITLRGAPLPLWVVHTTAPTDPGVREWSQELDGVHRLLVANDPRPLLMVGDLNATWGNRGFRAILATGLTDAAAARGRALDMTWSQRFFLLPPLVRIDHVLTSPGVVVTTIQTGPGPGSQHRDLLATVALVHDPRRGCGPVRCVGHPDAVKA